MGRRPRGSSASRKRKTKVLARLNPTESAGVLRSLLHPHPQLVAEAEELARAAVSDVDSDAVAENVEQAVLDLDLEDLGARAGGKSWGFIVLGLYRCRSETSDNVLRLGRGLPRGDCLARSGHAGAREPLEAPSHLAAF